MTGLNKNSGDKEYTEESKPIQHPAKRHPGFCIAGPKGSTHAYKRNTGFLKLKSLFASKPPARVKYYCNNSLCRSLPDWLIYFFNRKIQHSG